MNPESIAKRLLEGDDAFSAEEYLKSGSEEASTLIYDGPLVDIIIPHNVHTVNDYIVHGSSKWSEDYYNKQAVNPIYIVVVKADNGLDGQLTEDHGSAIVQFEQNAATNQNGGVIPARDIKKWFTEAQWKDVQSGFTQYFQSQIAAKKNAQQAVANLIMIGRTDLAANYSRYLGKVKLPTSTAIETALHMKKLGKRQRNKIARFMKRHPDVDWRENGFYLLFNDWSDTTGFFEHNSRHDFQRVAAEVFGGDLRNTLNVWDATSSEDAFGITNDKNKNLIRQLLVGRPCVNEDGEEFTMTEEMVFDLDDSELWTVIDDNSDGSTKDIYNQLRYSAVTAEESALESAYERVYQQAVIDAFKAKAGDSVWRPIRKDGKVKHMLAFFIPYATLEEWLNRWKEEYGEDEYDFDGTIHELAERFADRATPPEIIDSSDFDSDYYNEDLEQQLHELPAWQPERKAPEPGQEEMKFDDPDAPPRELQKPRTVKVGQPPNEHAYPGIPNDIAHKYKEKVPDARIESLVTGLLEREEPKSAFHKPENFDKVHDGKGWEMWAGANDWEIGHSAACVMFSAGDGLSKRIWMEIKHPNGNDDSQVKHDDQDARVKHGKEAVDTWISVARKLHGDTDYYDWYDCFKDALSHEEMAPFVDKHGEDKSTWTKDVIESVDPKDYAMENPPIGFRLQAVHRSGQPIYFLRGSWVKTPEDASVYPSVEAAEEEADRCDPAGGWRKLQDVRVEPVYAKRVAENEDPKDFIEREMPVCHYRIVAEYLGDPVYLCNYDNGWHQDRLGAMLFDSPDDAQQALSTKHRPDWMKKDPVIEPIPRDECTCYAPVGESEIDPKEYVQSEHRLNKKSDGTYSCSCGRWNFTSVGDSGKRAKEEHALHVQGLRESLLTEDIYKRSTTQIDLPEEIGQHIISWGKLNIPDDALYVEEDGGCGRETEQHVTVLYGLTDAQPSEALKEIVQSTKPFMIELAGVSLFENEKFDVVKLDVISEELTNLSNAIRKACPNDNKFPDYHGHVTIAYVKPGRGKEFAGQDVFKSSQVGRNFWAYDLKFNGAGDSEDPNRVVENIYFDKSGDPGHEEPANAEQRFPQADEKEEEEPALAESEVQRVDLDTLIKRVGDMQREAAGNPGATEYAPLDPKEFVGDNTPEFYALRANFSGNPQDVFWYSHVGWRPGKAGRQDAVGFLSFGAAAVAAELERARHPGGKIDVHPVYDADQWWDDSTPDDPVVVESEEAADPKELANEITLTYLLKVWANNVPLFWNNATNRWVPHESRATVMSLENADKLQAEFAKTYPTSKFEVVPDEAARPVGVHPVELNKCPECGSVKLGEPDEEGLVDCLHCGVWFDPKHPGNAAHESDQRVDPKEFLAEQIYIVRRGSGPKSTYLHHKPETHNWDWVDDLDEATRLTQKDASHLVEFLGHGTARVELAENEDPKEFLDDTPYPCVIRKNRPRGRREDDPERDFYWAADLGCWTKHQSAASIFKNRADADKALAIMRANFPPGNFESAVVIPLVNESVDPKEFVQQNVPSAHTAKWEGRDLVCSCGWCYNNVGDSSGQRSAAFKEFKRHVLAVRKQERRAQQESIDPKEYVLSKPNRYVVCSGHTPPDYVAIGLPGDKSYVYRTDDRSKAHVFSMADAAQECEHLNSAAANAYGGNSAYDRWHVVHADDVHEAQGPMEDDGLPGEVTSFLRKVRSKRKKADARPVI